jgi:CelD/BcsL family acetyltransferase involved in cellulose biosynthesis
MYEVKVHKNLDDQRLKQSWEELYAKKHYCLQNSYTWIYEWWKYFQNKNRELFVVTVEDHGKIVGIAPFMIERAILFKQLKFIGSGLTDFHMILTEPDKEKDVAQSLIHFVQKQKQYSLINLEQVPDFSALSKICIENELFQHREMIKCPVVILSQSSWEEYFGKVSKNLKRDWTKKHNKIHREKKVKFEKVNKSEEKKKILTTVFKLHVRRWEGENHFSKFGYRKIQEFLTEVIQKIPQIVIYTLSLDDEIVSYRLGFDQDLVFYDWNTSYNPEYQSYSIGRILLGLIFKDLIENNYKKFNFMRGNEEYKRKWMVEGETLTNYQFLSATRPFIGRMAVHYYLGWKWWMRKRLRRILKISLVQKFLLKMRY